MIFFPDILRKLGIFSMFVKIKYPSKGKNGTRFITMRPRLLKAINSIISRRVQNENGKNITETLNINAFIIIPAACTNILCFLGKV